jgi:uncharacterized protein (TIRG00374 family)
MTARARVALLLKIAVTVTLLAYLAGRLDWADLGKTLRGIDAGKYTAGILVVAVAYALTTARWRLLLAGQGLELRYRTAVSIDLVALFFNSFLPGATGGDAMRVYYASRLLRGEVTRLVAAVIVDRLIGLATLLSFGYVAFLLRPGIAARFPALQELLYWLPLVLSAGLAACLVALLVPRRTLPRFAAATVERASSMPVIGRLVVFGRQLRRRPYVLPLAVGVTVAAQLVGFSSAYLVARSIGIAIDYPEIILIMAITQTAISLPISVAGHGVREVVLIGVFAAMGISAGHPEVAIAFSVLLFSAQLFWSLVGGIWFAVRPRYQRPYREPGPVKSS